MYIFIYKKCISMEELKVPCMGKCECSPTTVSLHYLEQASAFAKRTENEDYKESSRMSQFFIKSVAQIIIYTLNDFELKVSMIK